MSTESESLSDLELARRLQAGDMDAFRLIYDRYYRYVRHYCAKFVKNEVDAEDVTQDTFMQVLTKINKFDIHRKAVKFKWWMTTIAFNRAMDYFRRQSTRRDFEFCALEKGNLGPNVEPRAEQELFKKEFTSAFWKVVKTLPEPARQCFACHYLLDIKYVDLCRIYGLRRHQIAPLVSSAQRRLAKELRAYV